MCTSTSYARRFDPWETSRRSSLSVNRTASGDAIRTPNTPVTLKSGDFNGTSADYGTVYDVYTSSGGKKKLSGTISASEYEARQRAAENQPKNGISRVAAGGLGGFLRLV